MELVNEMASFRPEDDTGRAVFREAVDTLLRILGPMVPHMAEELWEALGHTVPLSDTPWPEADRAALQRDEITVVVQVNGRVRGRVAVPPDADETLVREAALADENVRRHMEGKTLVKTVWVPGRLVNLVVR